MATGAPLHQVGTDEEAFRPQFRGPLHFYNGIPHIQQGNMRHREQTVGIGPAEVEKPVVVRPAQRCRQTRVGHTFLPDNTQRRIDQCTVNTFLVHHLHAFVRVHGPRRGAIQIRVDPGRQQLGPIPVQVRVTGNPAQGPIGTETLPDPWLAINLQVFQSLCVDFPANPAVLILALQVLFPQVRRFQNMAIGVYDLGVDHPTLSSPATVASCTPRVMDRRRRVSPTPPPSYQATGRDFSERNVMLGWYSSSSVSRCKEGKRSAKALKASWPSSR